MRIAFSTTRPAHAGGFAPAFVGTVALFVGALAILTVWRDPYWIFRDNPPWTRNGAGASRLLDVEMRLIKPLQIARLKPETLLIGSSVVYRGLDPHDVKADAGRVYNAGFSSLMADELPTLAALAVDIGSVKRVVIELDYFMFTALPAPPAIKPQLAKASGRIEATIAAILNPEAPGHLIGQQFKRTEPGLWRADGYKATPDFDAELTRRITQEQKIGALIYRPGGLVHLERALDLLRGREVVLVLSPMSGSQRELLGIGGRAEELTAWRRDVAALAARRGVPFHDLVSDHPFDDFDPEKGSSPHWIDTMHFKPALGRWVLSRIGLAAGGAGAAATSG